MRARVDAVTLDPEQLRAAMRRPLPGLAVQLGMAPPGRPNDVPVGQTPRHAGVLILTYPHQEVMHLVLTRRSDKLNKHKGQVSFPGGSTEPGDADYTQTALREAREELGVHLEGLSVLGTLTPLFVPPSNFVIHPAVAYIPYRPQFAPQTSEVAELLEVPLAQVLDPAVMGAAERALPSQNGLVRLTPHYLLAGHQVWGATAMVLAEFIHVLRIELDHG